MDFYGVMLSLFFNFDMLSIVLYSLNKYFVDILFILQDMLREFLFVVEDLEVYIRCNQCWLAVDLVKNDILVYCFIMEQIFGSFYLYGYNSISEVYLVLLLVDLKKYY